LARQIVEEADIRYTIVEADYHGEMHDKLK